MDTIEHRETCNPDTDDRQCALKGLEIMRVEIPSGKELTNPPEVSFELLVVTLVAKRKQRDSRDSYPAPKYPNFPWKRHSNRERGYLGYSLEVVNSFV